MENYSIIRTNRAGLFFGVVEKVCDVTRVATLVNVRKLHYWEGAAAPEELAMSGVKAPESCRFTVVVPRMKVAEWVQIIPCTDSAKKSLESVREWTA